MNNIGKFLGVITLFAALCVQNCALANNKNEVRNMTRTEICKENYRDLFGGEALSENIQDAEFMAILQKYIFGEVFTIGNLDKKTREMLTVVSLATQQTLPQLNAHINAALNVGVKPLEIREALYMTAPFIGFPKALNAIGVMNEVFKSRNIDLPLPDTTNVVEENRFATGQKIQEPLYGDEIKQVLSDVPGNMGAETARLLTEVCFGDYYSRGGLDVKTRELLAVSILVSNGNLAVLKSHIKGNIKAGNSPETIAAAIVQVMPYVGFPNAIESLKILSEAIKEVER